ncbi:Site-specific recombinase XerD [Desulfatibacillum alkenivorans DSM 16219]|jgi:integrase|uniref:Site-specific recombinase XerD n=1 Tax=Desulfatibacillum alkenivorans DSM 16219 TaxID=1121393 RepID=A0A1M6N3E9_9BACT|nr:site-specific integrase [Desulfatibacillum alkenivorans]SHJ90168.1 Site-specific recombinase XerD [Desulfatibacillum alkenivorans DSM 16219]
MSLYFKPGKGWRYDFTLNSKRHTKAWFKTKAEARRAEAQRREEVENPQAPTEPTRVQTQTGTDFLTLCNKRLDHVNRHNSESHFRDVQGHTKRWCKEWGRLPADSITEEMMQPYLDKRAKISHIAANKDLQYLRALFNFGIKKKMVHHNPAKDLEWYTIVKRKRRIPPKEDVLKVISVADPETQDYLWCMLLTAARVNEINSLVWDDVDFENKTVTLWTRKKKGGHKEPRLIPMTEKLSGIMASRYKKRDPEMPWVFWHTFWSRTEKRHVSGPYQDRKKIMFTLCEKAKVTYFRFHPFRHFTASILQDLGVPIGVIQSILGHENQKTTEIYLQTVNESERRAMVKLDELDIIVSAPIRTDDGPTNPHKEYWHRKVKRPPLKVLKRDVARMGYRGTGRKYGVSDNAVRKWIKVYENGNQTSSGV